MKDSNAVWLTRTVVGTGACVITTSSEISKILRVFSKNEGISRRSSENKIAKHADRRQAWTRAAQDDLEDTYRETVVSGNLMRLIIVLGICITS